MALIRDLPFPVTALSDSVLITCSTADGGAVFTATADAVVSAGGVSDLNANGESTSLATKNGRVIDRLSQPLGSRYYGVTVAASLHSSRGSTQADRKLGLGVRLFHGDSSGGGDLAEYGDGTNGTNFRVPDRIYFTSARTTDMQSWSVPESSGPLDITSNAAYYDLRGAKRYVQVRVRAGKNLVTTGSAGDEQSRLSALATFVAGDEVPPPFDTRSPFSTSTST